MPDVDAPYPPNVWNPRDRMTSVDWAAHDKAVAEWRVVDHTEDIRDSRDPQTMGEELGRLRALLPDIPFHQVCDVLEERFA